MADLIIRNGSVVDGTGAKPRLADVAITGGRITEIAAAIGGLGRREIDADGMIVTPGFVARVVAFVRGAAADLHPELSLAALSETSMGLTVSVVSSTEERVELQVTAIANLDAAVLEHDELNFETSRAALASAAQSVLLLDGTDSPVDTSGLH